MKSLRSYFVSLLFVLGFTCSVYGQDSFTLTVNPQYNVMNKGIAIPYDFAGLGFETESVLPNQYGLSGYFFSASNNASVTLFRNLSLRNLRVGGGTVDGCSRFTPASADITALFGFAAAANLKVIYSLPLENPSSCLISGLAGQNGATANTIMTNYAANLHSFSLGNEVDFHSYHTFCDTYSGNCNCVNGSGCSTSGTGALTKNDLSIFETYNPCTVSSPPCQSGAVYQPGSSFTSYFADWASFVSTIKGDVTSGTPVFSGPDSGDYYGGTEFSGNVGTCNNQSFTNATWTQMLATCESVLGATNFSLPTQHLYVGGGLGSGSNELTTDDAINNMLSRVWVANTTPSYEAYGTTGTCRTYPAPSGCPSGFSPYPYMATQVPAGTRLTESNDFLGGSSGASNAFASALWALDYMQWWAAEGASGVNFHNNPWLFTDTIVPSNVTGSSTTCSGTCSSIYEVNPKGYGIKAFDLGGHGYSIPVTPNPTTYEGHIDAYAVGSGQDLYVTIVNKTNAVTANAETADVTIDLTNGSGNALPFATASVSSMALTDVTGGGAGDVTIAGWTATTIGGSNITDSGPWYGLWNNTLSSYTGGNYSVTVPAGTATIYKFHASSYYAGPIQINQSGSVEMAAIDSSGSVYHNWQTTANEPASAPGNWNASGSAAWSKLTGVTASGNPAEIKNGNNTLEIFVPTSGDVYHIWQLTPGGAWSNWTDMGSSSNGMTDIQVGQNADGGLTVFGLSGGEIYYSTESAPGAGWSTWTTLGSSVSGGLQAGYVVAQNLNGRVEVFAADGSSSPQVWHAWQTLSGPFTTAWSTLTTGGASVSKPQLAVARNLNGDLEVFGIGTDGYVWHSSQASPSAGPWSTWSELETGTQKALQPGFAVGQNNSGDLVVFGVVGTGSAAAVYYNAQSSPGGSYSSTWTPLAMSAGDYPANSQMVISSNADGRMQIFCIGYNGSTNDVFTNWQTSAGGSGSWNGWSDFGSGSGGLTY